MNWRSGKLRPPSRYDLRYKVDEKGNAPTTIFFAVGAFLLTMGLVGLDFVQKHFGEGYCNGYPHAHSSPFLLDCLAASQRTRGFGRVSHGHLGGLGKGHVGHGLSRMISLWAATSFPLMVGNGFILFFSSFSIGFWSGKRAQRKCGNFPTYTAKEPTGFSPVGSLVSIQNR